MSSTTPRPSKRPRLSQSTSASTLRAPFKSPLRPRDSNAPAASSPSIPTKHAAAPTKANHLAANSGPLSSPGQNGPTPPSKSNTKTENNTLINLVGPPPSSPQLQQQQRREATAAPAAPPDDDLPSLQRTHTRLLNTLAASKRDLETALQARKLEASSSIPPSLLPDRPSAADDDDDECAENKRLKQLIERWRGASRDAAEVVYVSAKARVEGMGGMEGMRAREREKWEWRREEERVGREVERVREGRGKVGDLEVEGAGNEAEEEGREEEEEEEEDEGGGGGEYTMGMMLQGFGIELKSIGWDEAGGKWID